MQQLCKWGRDKSATCSEGQPWVAVLCGRSLWKAAIDYSLCFIVITKAEEILAASDGVGIGVHSFKIIIITKCCSGSSYPLRRHYCHDLPNHIQIYCVSRLLKKCTMVIFGIAVDIKTACYNWNWVLLEHRFYAFTFMCGIGSCCCVWFSFFFGMGFPEQLLCPLKLSFFHFEMFVYYTVFIEPFCTVSVRNYAKYLM